MAQEYEVFNANFVFLGSFNPVIFHPEWLIRKELIRKSDVLDDSVEIIHSTITRIKLKWCELEIKQNRFDLKTTEENYIEPLKDLAVSIFKILGETPVSAFGVNYLFHFTFRNKEKYLEAGFKLSPLKEMFSFFEEPRLLDIVVLEQKKEEGKENERLSLRILPSDIISDNKSIVMRFNHHFNDFSQNNGKHIAEQLNSHWKFSCDRVLKFQDILWNQLK